MVCGVRNRAQLSTIGTIIDMATAFVPLVARASTRLDWVLKFQRCRAERTSRTCSTVCGRGSLGARQEFAIDAYFDLETVRAIAITYTCTHL